MARSLLELCHARLRPRSPVVAAVLFAVAPGRLRRRAVDRARGHAAAAAGWGAEVGGAVASGHLKKPGQAIIPIPLLGWREVRICRARIGNDKQSRAAENHWLRPPFRS